ncbi:MAG: elongator complex protein 3 [Acutalibacteraceae bacterium]|nr:radical SAM protein [Oscillospiraceae bacterium]
MRKHTNIALFVPHLGCPHRCSFCNQKSISGCAKQITPDDEGYAVETALKSGDCADAQIAFFGGSFTAIDRDYMISLLEKAHEYIKDGRVGGIRISTRPDCIDSDILTVLKQYGVTAIELGCQSMDDEVLRLNNRGHDSGAVERASKLIKAFGFELGHQMMTGLYGSTDEKDKETAEKLIALRPDTVRIYPTVVLENTELCEKYRSGQYAPQSLEEAVGLCSELLKMFNSAGIPVIRLGLHSGGNVEEGFVAGVYHPAFRELCESRIYLDKALALLKGVPEGEIEMTVSDKFVSQALGQKKSNIKKLNALGYKCRVIQDPAMKKYDVKIVPKGN